VLANQGTGPRKLPLPPGTLRIQENHDKIRLGRGCQALFNDGPGRQQIAQAEHRKIMGNRCPEQGSTGIHR
jgi:hypothetical protein